MSLDVEPAELAGRLARDAHGRPLGEVEAVFDGRKTRFVGIDTERGRVVVPVDGAEVDPVVYALDLPYMTDRISAAPTVAPDAEELDAEVERRVIEHFGPTEPPAAEATEVMEPVADDELPTAAVPPAAPPEPEPGDELTLTEEQLVVDTERLPAQRVRIRKEIVEEQVTVTVTLRHEELVIERESIKPGDAPPESADAPRLDQPPIEIVLWAEEPVVSTRAVPTERVRVLRTLGSEQRDLTAQLRRERASFEHPIEEEQG
jgi:uncharacterized protein (TIGR02271 family)